MMHVKEMMRNMVECVVKCWSLTNFNDLVICWEWRGYSGLKSVCLVNDDDIKS